MNYSTVNCSILQKNIVVYHKEQCFTAKCDILPQSVVIPLVTLLRIVVFYYKVTIKYNILLQNVILYHNVLHLVWYISHGFHYYD